MEQKWGDFSVEPFWTGKELATLKRCALFQGADEALIRAVRRHPGCGVEEFQRAEPIYSPNKFRRCLGVLLEGHARVSKGRLAVSVLGPGDLFGAAALFHRRERFESTIAAKEGCVVAFFSENLMLELLGKHPEVCGAYLRYLSERIHFLNQKVDTLSAAGAEQKLARYLLSERRKSGTVTCPAAELARRLDLGRTSLYRAFEALEGQGVIRRDGKTVEILDLERLEEVGED